MFVTDFVTNLFDLGLSEERVLSFDLSLLLPYSVDRLPFVQFQPQSHLFVFFAELLSLLLTQLLNLNGMLLLQGIYLRRELI